MALLDLSSTVGHEPCRLKRFPSPIKRPLPTLCPAWQNGKIVEDFAKKTHQVQNHE